VREVGRRRKRIKERVEKTFRRGRKRWGRGVWK
jgi:hypothetical protein